MGRPVGVLQSGWREAGFDPRFPSIIHLGAVNPEKGFDSPLKPDLRPCVRSLLESRQLRLPAVKKRRLYDQRAGHGYLESDKDFVANNLAAAVWFLENRDRINCVLKEDPNARQVR